MLKTPDPKFPIGVEISPLAMGLVDCGGVGRLGFGVALYPPIQWVLDAITAVVLFAVLGFRWPLLPALAIEVVPGLQLFPAWTLVVAALASAEKAPQDVEAVNKSSKPFVYRRQKSEGRGPDRAGMVHRSSNSQGDRHESHHC